MLNLGSFSKTTLNMNGDIPVLCPITKVPLSEFRPCPPEELDEISEWLMRRESGDIRREFLRGIVDCERLDLCKQSLGPNGAQRILRALDGNRKIRSLLMGTDGLGDVGAKSVADAMKRNGNLETIYLGCNGITAAGVGPLCEAIESGSGTAALWLKRNPIGLDGAARVAQMLARPHSLRTLDLVNTGISDDGACQILRTIIKSPQRLERLYLGGNGLTVTSTPIIAELLASCPGIRALYLSTNLLLNEGANELAGGFSGNRTLQEFSLASNGLTSSECATFFKALRHLSSLTFLDLGSTPSAKVLGAPENQLGGDAIETLASSIRDMPELRALSLRDSSIDAESATRILDACESRTKPDCVVNLHGNPCSRRVRKRSASLAQASERFPEAPDVRAIRSAVR